MNRNDVRQGAREAASEVIGTLWFIGWLFTLAYAQLLWWQAVLGIVVWPYYLGVGLR